MVGNAISRRPTGRQSAAIVVILLVVGALTLSVALQGNPQTPPAPSASPSAQPSSQTAAQWASLDLEPLAVPATLEPSARDEAGIPADATFTLVSLTDEPASAIADRLEISPATTFAVAPTSDPATATITPATQLATGDTYRFALRTPDGAIATSWAFRVRGPVNVISTTPGDANIGVPVRTGIEVTFDQEGVADMADHFSIDPVVAGTFERHGRTQVFVPSSLEPATTYTVTIREGLARTGMDLALPADVVFRFETESPPRVEPWLVFGREVLEAGPTQQLDIAIHAIRPWQESGQLPAPTSANVRIYRIPSLDAANQALADFLSAPRWTEFSEPLMRTDGFKLVGDFNAPLESLHNDVLLLRLPSSFDPGWYIIEIQGSRRAQAFLQVTPVSAWVSVMDDRTVAWINDVATHQPVEGATVAVGSGRVFATSDAEGLAIGATPTALLPPAAGGDTAADSPILRVTSGSGDVVLVPFNVVGEGQAYRGEWWETFGSADETYWAMLYTDRGLYRRDDRIQAWGYLRGRDDGEVPASVQVRLVPSDDANRADVPAIVSVDVRPGVDGAFTVSLPIAGLPNDEYQVQAIVDGRVVLSRWVQVTIIRKPPYQLELSANHTAVITGTPVTITAAATFFDGTPVASLNVEVSADDGEEAQRVKTDAAGKVSVTVQSPTTSSSYQHWRSVNVHPVGPEGSEIWASATTVIFPSAYQIDADAVLSGGEVQFTGLLSEVDLARVERELKVGWDGDAAGVPVVGRTLQVTVTELVPIRRQVGSEYDFIEKVVRPVYEYDNERSQVRTLSIESGAGGKLAFSIPVLSAEHQYEILLSTLDDSGRLQLATTWASPKTPGNERTGIQFLSDDGKLPEETSFAVGDMVAWRMVDDGKPLPSGEADRYLYLIAQRGLRAAVVTDTPRFRHRFAAADAPGIFVMGVRFTGTTYAPKASGWADFDRDERAIRVQVSADRERHRPGETARLSVRTTHPNGSPVAATVVLQAVDEKLYAIGGATVPDPLQGLYDRVDSGIVRLTATHQVPTMSGREGEGGDTTGGGDDGRTDFRDSLLFRELRTDATGRASTTVRLSDDLTSWHVVASAVTSDLRAGAGELLLPVGLPFFVELTVADTYQVSDRPVVQVRAFGEALRKGDRVDFSVASPSLGLAETRISGTAFEPVSVELPSLSPGSRSIIATAVAPTRKDVAGRSLTDGLTRTFEVVTSRLSATKAAYGTVEDGLPAVPDGAEQSLWTFSDAGRGRLIPLLSALAEPAGTRLDRSIAQQMAGQMLVAAFGREPSSLPPVGFDSSRYTLGGESDDNGAVVRWGVDLVPQGGVDPWLAARVAVTAPEALPTDSLRQVLAGIRDLPTSRRDIQIAALAGLAALGEPVLGDLQDARRQPDLTPSELIYLALGFQGIGDDSTAQAIERDLLARHGEGLGAWVRLRFEATDDGADATALLAVVAAGLGDPLAAGLADYASSNPATDTANALELAAYARRTLERTPAAATSFAYTVDGQRSTVRLEPGDAFSLRLTAVQAATLSVETMSGRVGVAVEARVPVAPSSLRPHPDLSLVREVREQPIPTDQIIEVNLTATFGERAPDGCYDVAEIVPSGLAPMSVWWGPMTDESGITWPSSVVGQDVRFCAWNDAETGHSARLRYRARVVNEGTFAWEPAIMELPGAPELLAITSAGTASIGAR